MKPLTAESLKDALAKVEAAPQVPVSINFSSVVDRDCALEAWQAKPSGGGMYLAEETRLGRASLFRGVPVKITTVLPPDTIAFEYSEKITFFNVLTGRSWILPSQGISVGIPM